MSDHRVPANELTGLRILDVGDDLAAGFGARLARLHGARVDRLPGSGTGVPRTAGQRCLLEDGTRTVAGPTDDGGWREFLAPYDIVITARGAASDAARQSVVDGQIHMSITPFGRNGPSSWWQASDTALALMSGTVLLGRRLPDSVKIPGTQCEFTVGAVAFVALCAAVLRRRRQGAACDVDLAKFEVLVSADNGLYSAYSYLGSVRTGIDATFVTGYPVRVYDAKDEPVFVAPGFGNIEMLPVLVERPELIDHELFQNPVARQQRTAEFDALVENWFAAHDARTVEAQAQRLRMPFARLSSLRDLPADEQLAHRGFFTAGRIGGTPVHVAGTPISRRFGPEPTGGDATPTGTPAGRASAPLRGVRVVDLTRAYAGPIASAMLAELGADVVKVEATGRIDMPTRGTNYADNDLTFRPWDRAGFYHSVNSGKQGVTLDLATEDGMTLLRRLISDSDVLIENSSARVLPNMGLTDDALGALNQRLVLVGMSAFGRSGPRRDWVGYAQGMEAAAGMMRLGGHDGDPYLSSGCAYADWVLGIYGAASAVLGLIAADSTGQGSGYDVAGVAGVAGHLGDEVIDAELAGHQPARAGNRDGNGGHAGVYVAADGQPVAVHARTPAEAARLGDITAEGGPIGDFGAVVGSWVAARPAAQAVDELQRAGVVAVPVLGPDGVLLNEQLLAREYFEVIDHPLVGRRPHQRFLPAIWNGEPRPARTPAPMLGEHNETVLGRRLGLSGADLDRLARDGVIGTEPTRLPRRLRDRSLDLAALERAGVVVIDPDYRSRLSAFFGVTIGEHAESGPTARESA